MAEAILYYHEDNQDIIFFKTTVILYKAWQDKSNITTS